MTNRVHVQHVLEFLRWALEGAKADLAYEQVKYDKAKAKYELKLQTSFWCKLYVKLGFKPATFEQSSEGTLDWMCSQWDDYIFDNHRVQKYKQHIQTAEYHYKCRDVTMEWTFVTDIQHFYAYCQKNNIPH